VGTHGRLGHGTSREGFLNNDCDHPTRVLALQVSCVCVCVWDGTAFIYIYISYVYRDQSRGYIDFSCEEQGDSVDPRDLSYHTIYVYIYVFSPQDPNEPLRSNNNTTYVVCLYSRHVV
jgi:hypothetical protein